LSRGARGKSARKRKKEEGVYFCPEMVDTIPGGKGVDGARVLTKEKEREKDAIIMLGFDQIRQSDRNIVQPGT